VFHISHLVIEVFFGWLSGDGTEFWANATQWTPELGVWNVVDTALPLISKVFGYSGFKHCRNFKRFLHHNDSDFAETIRCWSCIASAMLLVLAMEWFVAFAS